MIFHRESRATRAARAAIAEHERTHHAWTAIPTPPPEPDYPRRLGLSVDLEPGEAQFVAVYRGQTPLYGDRPRYGMSLPAEAVLGSPATFVLPPGAFRVSEDRGFGERVNAGGALQPEVGVMFTPQGGTLREREPRTTTEVWQYGQGARFYERDEPTYEQAYGWLARELSYLDARNVPRDRIFMDRPLRVDLVAVHAASVSPHMRSTPERYLLQVEKVWIKDPL